MIWLYRLLYLPTLLIALPYYGLRMWRRGGYAKDFRQRLGFFYKLKPSGASQTRIWLQAVSVGEVLAIGPLIQALKTDPKVQIILTTTTSTGYAEALKRYRETACGIGLFPLDFWPCMRLAWKRIQPNAIILAESELWPEHLHQACKKHVPTFLINARLSDRSFKRYQKFSGLARRLLKNVDFIYTASDLDQERFVQLGISNERIGSTGNIKFDVKVGELLDTTARAQLYNELGFGQMPGQSKPFVLLGSSTWPGEEEKLVRIHARLIEIGVDCRLLLVPRHAERGPEIAEMLKGQKFVWQQRSKKETVPEIVHIYLADTTGELARLTQIADLAFIGKSLPPNQGGQTPIEAAGLGVPILMGPYMNNFKDVAQSLVVSGAALTVNDEQKLELSVRDLVKDSKMRAAMSQAGREWHKKNRGSSTRIAKAILRRIHSN